MLWKGEKEDVKTLYPVKAGQPLLSKSGYLGDGYLSGFDSEASIVGTASGPGTIIEGIDYIDDQESVTGISVDPGDGSFWLRLDDDETIWHLDREGARLQDGLSIPLSYPSNIAVDPFDGTIWYTEWAREIIHHMERDGTNIPGDDVSVDLVNISGLDIDPVDGTFWIPDRQLKKAINVDRNGDEISAFALNGEEPYGIAVDPIDGALWQGYDHNLWNLTREGIIIKHVKTKLSVTKFAIDPADGSLWLADNTWNKLLHVSVFDNAMIIELPDHNGKFLAHRRGGL